jgi:hypothetical protein
MPPTLFSSANTNTAQFLICLLGGIFCLIPLGMSSIVDFTQSPLLFTLTSLRFRDSAVFAASVTLPLFFEVTFEIISAIMTGKKTGKSKMNVDAVLLNTRERFLLFCGIVTIPMTALLPSNTYHLVNLYMCLRRSRTVFVFGGVVTSLSRYDNNNWPVRKCYLMLISLICGAAIGAFADNYSLLGAPSHLRNLSTVFNVCFSGTFVYCNCMWLCSDIPRLFKGFFSISGEGCNTIDTIQNSRGISRCPNLISPLVYATSTTLVGCLSVAAAMTFGGADKYGADALFLHNLMFIIYLLMIMYISERMLKNEVVRGLVSYSTLPTFLSSTVVPFHLSLSPMLLFNLLPSLQLSFSSFLAISNPPFLSFLHPFLPFSLHLFFHFEKLFHYLFCASDSPTCSILKQSMYYSTL